MDISELFSTPQGAVAQCVGFVAMAVALFIYTFHTRKRILLCKLLADLLWVVHYVLLGALSGAVINGINALREGVFYHREKRWASSYLWPVLFVLANALATVLTWQGTISLLPLVGSSLNVIGLWCARPKYMRLIAIPALSFWEVYSILTGSISSVLVNAISIVSAVYALIRDAWRAHHGKKIQQ